MLKEQFEQGQLEAMPTQNQILDFFRTVDENGNGLIERKELIRFFVKFCGLQ